MPLSLLIGLRFSRGRRRGGMVSLISVISTIGIALGVAVLIVGLSAMNGFERELNNRILAVVPHGEIEAVDQHCQFRYGYFQFIHLKRDVITMKVSAMIYILGFRINNRIVAS